MNNYIDNSSSNNSSNERCNEIADLSHELRSPLNVIYSVCQLIDDLNKGESNIDKEKLSSYIKSIKDNSKRLIHLTNDIIDISKGNMIKKTQCESYNIISIVENAALSLKFYAEEKDIALIVNPETEEKVMLFNKCEIERCIINLVSNALKFTPCGGEVLVHILDKDDKIQIEVIDNGEGIREEDLNNIFQRFKQVCCKEEQHMGSGLGLTIVNEILKRHDGTIHVESEINKGSKFIITLPVRN